MRIRPTIPIMVAADFGAAPAAAAQATSIALEVSDRFVIPAYRRLAEASTEQANAWAAFVSNHENGDVESLVAAYHESCDAWAEAQIIHTGPIALFLRYERFAFWPDARNGTQRALDALIASNDPGDLLPENLATNYVAGQGLTAMERLLFGMDEPGTALTAASEEAARRAEVGLALARNLNQIANEVLTDWTTEGGVHDMIAANAGWNNLFADGEEAARLLLTDLVGAFRLMHDVKLLPVLGEDINAARPRVSEAWRSGRAKRDLMLNLEASRAMNDVFAERLSEARRTQLDASFDASSAAIAALDDDLGDAAADPLRRATVEAARDAVKATQLLIVDILPADLGITLGFNALDGD
jgi:predicted lipoprotein